MCIVLATTAHPHYALVILDNRDEFILRPTSRPHWWSAQTQQILSARDLHRAEQGTWLGITKKGNFAVLTNYREEDSHDKDHPIQGTRSRGGMVTAWLTASQEESTENFIHRLLDGEGVKGVGGFSLVVGKLRRDKYRPSELEPMAIISNRCGSPDDVPWVAGRRGEVYGLSNAAYADPVTWPKVEMGKEKLLKLMEKSSKESWNEDELVDRLFGILDLDTLPPQGEQNFEDFLYHLRKSIFIPLIGNEPVPLPTKVEDTAAVEEKKEKIRHERIEEVKALERPSGTATPTNGTPPPADITGPYGTQRQTIILVDWDGNVTFRERALWDAQGRPIPRGEGDLRFSFQIEGWNGEEKHNGHHNAVESRI